MGSGPVIEYTVIRTARKTIALEVDRDARILVRAPKNAPDALLEAFVRQHEEWLSQHQRARQQYLAEHPEPTEEEKKALIARAKDELPDRVGYYAELMGLYPTAITITSARGRFGSCSAKNRLSFSWRLMQYPDEAIDYVVVHELAHIAHKDHGADFYARIAEVFPDYKKRRALLKIKRKKSDEA